MLAEADSGKGNMNKKKLLRVWSLVGGILFALIGVLHTAVTPMVYRGFSAVMPDRALKVAFVFGVMGAYIVFSGWLMVYASWGLSKAERWAWTVTLGNGACNSLAGLGAVVVGFRNPLVLIWFALALSMSVLATVFYKEYHRAA